MESLPKKALSGELSPGTTFGPYCILSHLATGGMAEIYLARASKIRGFQRLVVVKRIRPDSAQNEEFVEMFLDEARLVASLQHAHIAQVFDIGEFEGNYFFTMEFVRGEEVASILRRGWQRQKKIPLNHVLNIITQAASGLHYAHNRRDGNGDLRGIIHRDVSPSNILVGSDGSVKVIDFGVAKATNKEHQTTVGALKGKLAYMSPEQVVAKQVDRRSDVFSLGIVLYEMLTGQRLFQGDSDFLILNKVMNAEINPPSSIRSECPSQLDAIALKALSRNVDERYSSCEEFQIALEECAYDNHLKLNQRGLAQYLDQTFPEKRDFWEASQREDSSVEEFLVSNPALIKSEVGTLDPTEYDALSRSDIVLDGNASGGKRTLPLAPSAGSANVPAISESGSGTPSIVVSPSALPLRAPAIESGPLLAGLGKEGVSSLSPSAPPLVPASAVLAPAPALGVEPLATVPLELPLAPGSVGQVVCPTPPPLPNGSDVSGQGGAFYLAQPSSPGLLSELATDTHIRPKTNWMPWAGGAVLLSIVGIAIAVSGDSNGTGDSNAVRSEMPDSPATRPAGQDTAPAETPPEPKPKTPPAQPVENQAGLKPSEPVQKSVAQVQTPTKRPATGKVLKRARREQRTQARAAQLAKKRRDAAAAEKKRKADAKKRNVDSLFLPSGG